ncbi:MAG: rRNA maturation RNase YbeY [Campylobacterota bacterium]|nr:rRNA maturation RNase YbeY [Campylobacterota bacterium]
MLINVENQTSFPLPLEQLESIAKQLTDREIELIICDNATIQQANAEYRSKDHPTDVLSFPLEGDFDALPLGSIMISSDFAREKAQLLGHTPEEESILLFIHGLLHLLGYDHEVDKGEMRAEEERLIRELALPESLIVRIEK